MTEEEIDPFARGLRKIMEAQNIKAAPLSEAAGLGASAVRDLFRKGSSPKVSTAIALAKQLGRTVDEIIQVGLNEAPDDLRTNITAVAGDVGAGAQVELSDPFAKGNGLFHVVTPREMTGRHAVAVRVRGDSMEPVYCEGDILFYVRPTHDGVPTEALNRKCIAEDTEGRVWVKQVKLGAEPGTFNLLSINPAGNNMHGVALKWAAPVLLHLPEDLAIKVE